MCGIVAVATNSPDKTPAIADSLARLAPRGPDSEGTWISSSAKVRLGHRRLAIVDLSESGKQPMHNEDKSIWLVCNGEIYNFPDLRSRLEGLGHRFHSHSDSEAILHAYEQWGIDCIGFLEGMFAFIIWDENNKRLFAVKDRVGIKPLCYAAIPGGIALASDVSAILPLLPQKPEINPEAVAYAMSIRYIPSPVAIWKGVKKFEPGHWLTWSEKEGLKLSRYWAPPEHIDYSGNYSAEKWNELFSTVLEDHLLSDVPVGLFLSGGIDSSSIATGMCSIGYKPKAFTVSFKEYEYDEASVAKATAKALGLDHEILEIEVDDIDDLLNRVYDVYDEPHCNYGLIPMYIICKAASKHFKTVLAGDGGDECFGGYTWHRDSLRVLPGFLSPVINTLKKTIRPRGFPYFSYRLKNIYYSNFTLMQAYSWKTSTRYFPEEMEFLMSPCNLKFSDTKRSEPFEKYFIKGLPLMRALQRVDLMTFCAELINPKIDRASMGHSLEVRVPFLDRRVIEWALSRPLDPMEKCTAASKPILREFLRSHHLNEPLNNPKQGFSLKIGNRYDQDAALEQIGESWWVKSGFWHRDWRKIVDANISGRFFRIWSALMLTKWAEKWM
jgi:asparagine synthase (glutamine-hydrolysing)